MPGLRTAALRCRRHRRRLRRGRPVRPAPRQRRRAARFRARREADRRPRPGARLRRPGDEERRRLRRVAPRRGLARHARRDRRGLAQARAETAGRGHAAPRSAAGARARAHEPLGRPAAPAQRDRLARRRAHRAPVGLGRGRARCGREDRRHGFRRAVLGRHPRADRRVFFRARAAVAAFGSFNLGAARAAGQTAHRMERRVALAQVE